MWRGENIPSPDHNTEAFKYTVKTPVEVKIDGLELDGHLNITVTDTAIYYNCNHKTLLLKNLV